VPLGGVRRAPSRHIVLDNPGGRHHGSVDDQDFYDLADSVSKHVVLNGMIIGLVEAVVVHRARSGGCTPR
jgi:hypothetical protein